VVGAESVFTPARPFYTLTPCNIGGASKDVKMVLASKTQVASGPSRVPHRSSLSIDVEATRPDGGVSVSSAS
jgi:hypothetical protein